MLQQRTKDTRVPVSVTHKGKFTVRIYDMEAYQANIEQYYSDDEKDEKAAPVKQRAARPYRKKKPGARFDWTPKGSYMPTAKGA